MLDIHEILVGRTHHKIRWTRTPGRQWPQSSRSGEAMREFLPPPFPFASINRPKGILLLSTLIDSKDVGKPIRNVLLTNGGVVVLAVIGARLFFGDELKYNVHTSRLRVLVDFLRLGDTQHVVAAVHDKVGALHFTDVAL